MASPSPPWPRLPLFVAWPSAPQQLHQGGSTNTTCTASLASPGFSRSYLLSHSTFTMRAPVMMVASACSSVHSWKRKSEEYLYRFLFRFGTSLLCLNFPNLFKQTLKISESVLCSHFFQLCFCGSRLQGNRETSGLWELLLVTTYPGVPVLIMVVCYSLIFHEMRESRKRVEGCGARLVSNIHRREINFSRMLCYIFVRCSFPAGNPDVLAQQ